MLEYIWCFVAAALAGIGTGLAGLSAATVMVPILIVLCPSFTGETGAYQEAYGCSDINEYTYQQKQYKNENSQNFIF